MKKNNLIWGLLFILVGIFLILDRIGILEFNIFFSGWWTLFIIIPCLIELINGKNKISNIIGICIGVCLLLVMQNIITFELLIQLLLPIIFILIGLSLILKKNINKNIQNEVKKIKNKNNKRNEYNAVFSSEKLNFKDNTVHNMELSAIFGELVLDLRESKIPNEMLIETTSLFGKVEILVPEDVLVKTSGTSIFGDVTNRHEKDCKKVIYIENLCLFGGLDIK